MTSAVEKLEGLERRLKVSVTKEEVNKAYQERLNKIAKTANLKGFRPGKVPEKVIEQRFGGSIRQEIAGDLMQASFESAVEEHKLHIAGMPQIEPTEVQKDTPFEYDAVFEVYPEIDVVGLDGVSVEKMVATVSDADIQKMVENIRKQHAEWSDVDRAAVEGDKVVFDFEGFIDDKPFDGGKAEEFQLELGSKQMIPGFEDGLVGVKPADETEVKVNFPEEYAVKDLAGKPAVFKIKVHKVQESKLPDIDDNLAEKAGVEGGLSALLAEIRKGMEGELKQVMEAKLKSAVLDKLLEINKFTMPKSLIDAEVEHLQQMTRQQMAMQQGLKEAPQVDLPRDPFIEQAEKRVALGLLLAEVIKKHELKVDSDKVDAKIHEIAGGYKDVDQVVSWYKSNQKMMSEIEAVVLEDQVVAKLIESVKVAEKACSYEEAMNADAGNK